VLEKRRSIKVIVITGIDGSGKTTIAKILAHYLMSKNYRVRILWIKSLHTLSYLIYTFFKKTWGVEYIINPNRVIVEHYMTKYMKKLGRIWVLIEYISLLPWITILNILKHTGYTIICDRYLIDFLATVSLRISNPLWWLHSILARHLLALQMKEKTIHLNITIETALKRRKDIEYTLKELKTLQLLYKTIAKTVKAYNVKAEQDKLSTIKNVLKHLGLHQNSYSKS